MLASSRGPAWSEAAGLHRASASPQALCSAKTGFPLLQPRADAPLTRGRGRWLTVHSPLSQCWREAQPWVGLPRSGGGHLIAPPSPWRAHRGCGGGLGGRCSADRPRAAGGPAVLRGPPAGEPRAATTTTPARRGASAMHTAHLHHCRCAPASSITLMVVAGSPAHVGGMAGLRRAGQPARLLASRPATNADRY